MLQMRSGNAVDISLDIIYFSNISVNDFPGDSMDSELLARLAGICTVVSALDARCPRYAVYALCGEAKRRIPGRLLLK